MQPSNVKFVCALSHRLVIRVDGQLELACAPLGPFRSLRLEARNHKSSFCRRHSLLMHNFQSRCPGRYPITSRLAVNA